MWSLSTVRTFSSFSRVMDDILSHVLGASYRYRTPGGAVTTWWPHCTQDLSTHISENWPESNGNKRLTVPKTTHGCFGWYHRLNGHEYEQALVVGDGQGSPACCRPWSCKESDIAEWLKWMNCNPSLVGFCFSYPSTSETLLIEDTSDFQVRKFRGVLEIWVSWQHLLLLPLL